MVILFVVSDFITSYNLDFSIEVLLENHLIKLSEKVTSIKIIIINYGAIMQMETLLFTIFLCLFITGLSHLYYLACPKTIFKKLQEMCCKNY